MRARGLAQNRWSRWLLERTSKSKKQEHLFCYSEGSCSLPNITVFEGIAKTLISVLVVYQTDKQMISFLAESHKTLFRSLCAKFIKKDVFESAKKASLLIKLDVADNTNWKDVNSDDLGFGIKCELKRQIGSKKVTSMKVLQFKKKQKKMLEIWARLCSHAMEKSPLWCLFVKCLKCMPPNFMLESSRSCELIFEKTLEKLISCKQLPSREANIAKHEFSKFLSTTVEENKDFFVKFDKGSDHVDTFIWQFFLMPTNLSR